jgi:outer membrane protein, heavy metal efflux system
VVCGPDRPRGVLPGENMILTALLVFAAAAPPAWDLDAVLQRARRSPERLATEALLAEAERELSHSRGFLVEGALLTVEAGPRRSPEGEESDFALGVDLPLAADRAARRAARDAFVAAKPDLLASADLEAGLALRLAYVDAWEAAETLTLARRQAETTAIWLDAVQARVEAGTEAPYEATLVIAEAGHARLALAEARGRAQVTWSVLAARAEIGTEAELLEEPLLPPRTGLENAGGELSSATLARAITLRSDLARALLELEAARAGGRWSLIASGAREGREEVAHVGAGFRIPFSGESRLRAAALRAALAEEEHRARAEQLLFEGRLLGARERGAGLAQDAPVSPFEMERALAALQARVAVGRDRPSAVLPLRRQLLAALLTELAARAAALRAAFEIQILTTETP